MKYGTMNLMYLLYSLLLSLLELVQANSNLTAWQQHRRQKRFLIFQNGGVIKFVTGVAFPVEMLHEKRSGRQLVWLMNYHYQFNEPQTPIYWWNLFEGRDLKGPLSSYRNLAPEAEDVLVDEAQLMLFQFAESYMNQRGQNGPACLMRLICENAQIHEHRGLYAELLHRILRPHYTLEQRYRNAYKLGHQGIDCHQAYPKATHCLLDDYVHVHDRGLYQSFPKN